ncbi:TPA: flagellar protein FliT [Clostridioides difficile]|uniref:flagellar protein FliT n=1 Tax=Clostridioides difficile TaxID=1496 RepID=UPI0008721105|nr:flagellar protein FliT [Clostridioides difficile]AXU48566.1 hypothetical protein CDIF29629_00355 [Clostridioides difficile]AXU73988.1 hypothetical protein CDIF28670_00358 [Clostridioides difficile]EGT2197539.1 flagellar protein FliT [Clostridioides difficile]EGT4598719.1 flagellar protein FliT [Clostridioides difficile]EGT4907342.1 flagellar protein FliT [Clostridioides difficile]
MNNNLNEKLDLYRSISMDVIDMLNKDEYENIDNSLEKRQEILESIRLEDKEDFISIYKKEKLLDLDKEMKYLIIEKIEKVKRDLLEYGLTKQVNKAYSNVSREKINIFNKKV